MVWDYVEPEKVQDTIEVIEPSVKVLQMPTYREALDVTELAARTCYKSEDKIKHGSDIALIKRCIKDGHESVLEHVSVSLRFICDRGVSHELVRHRLAAYSQESTRYVRYNKDSMQFIQPWWWNGTLDDDDLRDKVYEYFLLSADLYQTMLDCGKAPQAARAVLPNAVKTEVVMTANLREWRHVFKLRTSKAAHPDMRRIMLIALSAMKMMLPVFFEDINTEE
jgi:thymidylate synthase (FAD)